MLKRSKSLDWGSLGGVWGPGNWLLLLVNWEKEINFIKGRFGTKITRGWEGWDTTGSQRGSWDSLNGETGERSLGWRNERLGTGKDDKEAGKKLVEIDSGTGRRDCDQGAGAGAAWERLSTLTRAGNRSLATAKNLEWERGTGAVRRNLQLKTY